jgi:hypothetical protein
VKTLARRMLRAARLDVDLYEEVEADKQTMGQATAVVVMSSLAAGLGTLSTRGVEGVVIATVGSLLGWYVWAYMTYFIGTRFLAEPQTQADWGELLRTIGFSSSPGIIRVLAIIAPLRDAVVTIAALWMLMAMVIAVRQALDYTSTWRALAVCAIGWVIQAGVLVALFFLLAD